MDVRIGPQRKLSTEELMLLNCGVEEDSRVPWPTRRSKQSILKEISPEYSLEGLMLLQEGAGSRSLGVATGAFLASAQILPCLCT